MTIWGGIIIGLAVAGCLIWVFNEMGEVKNGR
jgi:hypothetical protein